jgi:hypothetical protein
MPEQGSERKATNRIGRRAREEPGGDDARRTGLAHGYDFLPMPKVAEVRTFAADVTAPVLRRML